MKEGDDISRKKTFKRIGTHDGRFHADEVMATAILKEIFEVELVRTRDEEILNNLDIVYDVGGGEYDHHDMNKKYREDGIPYAACGLIWRSYGRQVISFIDETLSGEDVEAVFDYVDRSLVKGIDAVDNGIGMEEGDIPIMSISAIVSGFNPPWYLEKSEDQAFNEAVKVAAAVLNNKIIHKLSVLKSREMIEKAYRKRKKPELLILDTFCPYGEVLREMDTNHEVDFVIYKNKNSFYMHTVREAAGEDKRKLPEQWAGKRDEELAAVTGVSDAVFCHSGRFIAVARSFEGIMKLAELALSHPEANNRRGFISRLFKVMFSEKNHAK